MRSHDRQVLRAVRSCLRNLNLLCFAVRDSLPLLLPSNPTEMQRIASTELCAALLQIGKTTGAANLALSTISDPNSDQEPRAYYAVINLEEFGQALEEPRADRPRKPRRKVRTAGKYLILRMRRHV